MGSSSPRVYPHYVLETEVVPQRSIYNLDRHGHEVPALVTNIGFVAACPYLVIVRQVYIKD